MSDDRGKDRCGVIGRNPDDRPLNGKRWTLADIETIRVCVQPKGHTQVLYHRDHYDYEGVRFV